MGKRYLIDSNVLIEFVGKLLPENVYLWVSDRIDTDFNISFINKVEVLGHITANTAWSNFIDQAVIIMVDDEIIEKTIEIRKYNKIKIPDAFVAATAIVNELILLTRNTEDFKKIEGLTIENPWAWVSN